MSEAQMKEWAATKVSALVLKLRALIALGVRL
jgi:hypothetical protein